MDEPRLLSSEEKKALLASLSQFRNAQGFALNAAAIFIEVSTGPTDEARAEVAQQFRTFRDLFEKTIREATQSVPINTDGKKIGPAIETSRDIARRFRDLDEAGDFANVPAAEAGRLVNFVRLLGVPAIMQITAALSAAKRSHDQAVKVLMRERIERLDHMFNRVEDIGRMIHMISLNASVEAARAGGESGRSFKVIANEIRELAHQASVLIDTTREGVLPSAEADLFAIKPA